MEVCDRKKLGKGNEELFWIIILSTDILVWKGYLKGDIFGIFLKDNIKRVLTDGVLTWKYEYLNSGTHLPWDPGRECVQDKHGRAKLRESSVLAGVWLSALVPTCLEIEWMPWESSLKLSVPQKPWTRAGCSVYSAHISRPEPEFLTFLGWFEDESF